MEISSDTRCIQPMQVISICLVVITYIGMKTERAFKNNPNKFAQNLFAADNGGGSPDVSRDIAGIISLHIVVLHFNHFLIHFSEMQFLQNEQT